MTTARKPIDNARRAAMAKIHVAKKVLGLDDDIYRAMLRRITRRDSCSKMTLAQLDDVVAEMKRLGWQEEPPRERTRKRRESAPGHVRKIYALWNALVAAGGIEGLSNVSSNDASKHALRGFVVRQTGISAPEFLTGQQAVAVIEALKQRTRRERRQ